MNGHIPICLRVNGQAYELSLDPRVSLLDCLREHLDLTGTKKGCDQGACGACTVLVDGERINACLTPAVQCDGVEIITIEAMAGHELGTKVQQAFLSHDGFQCGYCTSGQICSTVAMLAEHRHGRPSAVTEDLTEPAALTDTEIRERMAGNLCRCGAYNGIVAAIREVAEA
ncbi:2Fe-2S iron-sulfur cluster-binding protein [Nonomuraea sp. NBC_00507]|uniref:2Fe-2S iron-sulfur cluster-binding protein n=1 Tax=Nonomuraea sp. NBC_00507 TaxID=2976002 RepID=UPI002E18B914